MRGYAQATRLLNRIDALTLLAVTTSKSCKACETGGGSAAVKKMLERRAAIVLPLTEAITQRAIALMELLTLSHGLRMGDALIAATALNHGLPALTGNVTHFQVVEGLRIKAFVP
ncbi:MAG: PIN domain-containing protein [Burkholderiales bacterium]